MYKKIILTLIIALAAAGSASAQICLKGAVSGDGESLPFARVSIFAATDTTRLVGGAVTDLNGAYSICNLRPGRYLIEVSYPGFEPLGEPLRLRMPSSGNVVTREYTLQPAATELGEVTVTADRVAVMPDKSVYRFTKEQREVARHSADLMEQVGDLKVDPVTGTLARLDGAGVTILINGVGATINDLRAIPADKIRKVDYYTLPPAKYAGTAGAVINVVTAQLDSGVSGGFDVTSAFTTGFVNGDAYLTYTSGHHRLAVDYALNFRRYSDRVINREYVYHLGGETSRYLYDSKSRFGYTTNSPRLKYTYSRPEDLDIQIVATPGYQIRFDNTGNRVRVSDSGIITDATGTDDSHSSTFSPSLDLYLGKHLDKRSEITANIVGTYFHSNGYNTTVLDDEAMSAVSYSDDMTQRVSKYSVIGELGYSRQVGMNKLNVGFRSTYARSWSDMRNLLSDYKETRYRSDDTDNYLYAEYSGMWRRLMFNVSLGGHVTHAGNDDASYTRFLFTPKLMLQRTFAKYHTVGVNFGMSPEIPTIAQLSNNAVLQTPRMIHTGNPYLHSSTDLSVGVTYELNKNWLQLKTLLAYGHEFSPINLTYSEAIVDGRQYVIASETNMKPFSEYGMGLMAGVRLFNDMLNLRVSAMAYRQGLEGYDGSSYHHWYCPVYFTAQFRKGAWGAVYQANIPSKRLSGSFLISDEPQSHLLGFWQKRNLRLTLGCFWLFSRAEYDTESVPNPYVYHRAQTYINDNRSMITAGVSWNFSTGKKKADIDRKIKNSDSDSGLFGN